MAEDIVADLRFMASESTARVKALGSAADEIERLRRLLLEAQPMVRFTDGGFDIEHWAVRLFALSFAESFKQEGGPNYITFETCPQEGEPLLVTIERKYGKGPAAQCSEAKKEAESLLAALKQRCACRFEDGRLIEECHFHQCGRCLRLENGDPSSVTWNQEAKRLQECLEEIRNLGHHPADYATDLVGLPNRYELLADRMADVANQALREEVKWPK